MPLVSPHTSPELEQAEAAIKAETERMDTLREAINDAVTDLCTSARTHTLFRHQRKHIIRSIMQDIEAAVNAAEASGRHIMEADMERERLAKVPDQFGFPFVET